LHGGIRRSPIDGAAASMGFCKIGGDWCDPDGFTMEKNSHIIAY
jgi:hypothetical protein